MSIVSEDGIDFSHDWYIKVFEVPVFQPPSKGFSTIKTTSRKIAFEGELVKICLHFINKLNVQRQLDIICSIFSSSTKYLFDIIFLFVNLDSKRVENYSLLVDSFISFYSQQFEQKICTCFSFFICFILGIIL